MGKKCHYFVFIRFALILRLFIILQGGGSPALAETEDVCHDLHGQDSYHIEDLRKTIEAAPGNSRRFAILIGNNYQENQSTYAVPKLTNAVNDARGIAAMLQSLQFKVACFLNATALVHDRILSASTLIGNPGDNGLTFYYFAGHGFANEHDTFSVGAGAERDTTDSLERGSVRQAAILGALTSRNAPAIAIFDMCREKLAPMTVDGKRNIDVKPFEGYHPAVRSVKRALVQYSTGPDDVAQDMPAERNGLYASVFLRETPNYPNVSVVRLLEEIVGTELERGISLGGKTYVQVPNLVSYPNQWSSIAIFDVSQGSVLDQEIGILLDMQPDLDKGLRYVQMICQAALQFRDRWQNAPEQPPGSRLSVGKLFEVVSDLQKEMKKRGFLCPGDETSSASLSVLPPIAHVNTKPVIFTSARSEVPTFQLSPKDSWLATKPQVILLRTNKLGTLLSATEKALELDNGFASSSGITPDKTSSQIFETRLILDKTKLIDTTDQTVVDFENSSLNIVAQEEVKSNLNILAKDNKDSQFLVITPATDQNVEQERLNTGRAFAVVRQLVSAGIDYDKVITPAPGLDAIKLPTLALNQVLVKRIRISPPLIDALRLDLTNPSTVKEVAKSFEAYRIGTSLSAGAVRMPN